MSLSDLKNSAHFSVSDLQKCHEEWNSSTADEKLDFLHHRELLVKQYAGVYYDESKEMKTSGSTTGMVKKYRWGPCYDDFFLFHYRLCFGHTNHDGIVYINLYKEPECRVYPIMPYGDTKLRMISTGDSTILNTEKIIKTINEDFKNPIIWLMPTQLEIMINREDRILKALLDSYDVFHCTGEICADSVKGFMFSKNKLLLDTMRVWNGGASFYTCKYGGLHWNDMSSVVEIKNGKLFSSDLWNCGQLFWGVDTGDDLQIHDAGMCNCGIRKSRNEWCDRVQIINLPTGMSANYQSLRRVFVETAAECLGCSCEDVVSNLMGVNFAVGENHIEVLYEFKQKTLIAPAANNKLSDFTGMRSNFVQGLLYGRFKNRRVSYLEKQNHDSLLLL